MWNLFGHACEWTPVRSWKCAQNQFIKAYFVSCHFRTFLLKQRYIFHYLVYLHFLSDLFKIFLFVIFHWPSSICLTGLYLIIFVVLYVYSLGTDTCQFTLTQTDYGEPQQQFGAKMTKSWVSVREFNNGLAHKFVIRSNERPHGSKGICSLCVYISSAFSTEFVSVQRFFFPSASFFPAIHLLVRFSKRFY